MPSFPEYAADKTRYAQSARVGSLVTEERRIDSRLVSVGNDWTRRHFDGDFYTSSPPRDLPAISVVFVQSREGNTAAENPADLGGGDTDLHLIYEGLSRVAADGVLAGATTAAGRVFFSVWRAELVALREALHLPRHPSQIVVSYDGHLDVEGTLLFNVPEARVFVLAGPKCRERCGPAFAVRP